MILISSSLLLYIVICTRHGEHLQDTRPTFLRLSRHLTLAAVAVANSGSMITVSGRASVTTTSVTEAAAELSVSSATAAADGPDTSVYIYTITHWTASVMEAAAELSVSTATSAADGLDTSVYIMHWISSHRRLMTEGTWLNWYWPIQCAETGRSQACKCCHKLDTERWKKIKRKATKDLVHDIFRSHGSDTERQKERRQGLPEVTTPEYTALPSFPLELFPKLRT